MNKHLRFIYLLLLLFGLSIHAGTAQTDFASEEEFKKQAAKLFDNEEFEKAYPLYSQLLSLYRKDPNYNFRLGVCMIYASDEKERAITFLEFATKNKDVEKEAFFYLAKAYHLNYRFDDAIAQYQTYKKIAPKAKSERLQVDRQIEMCKNGKKLLRNITDLPVIQKTELGREDFFRSYDISEIGGKLLVKPDEKEFRTPLDKKKNEKSILYLGTNSGQIYFSSYGNNEQRGKEIYQMKKTPGGEWGKPQLLGNTVNTEFDEDFPFLHPNGKVLYFSSKGHNSMGGYDIFKSTFNEETDSWGIPVNMDFPINTPDDDILYVTNADEKKAFFASARSSVASKISVYHINVERKPIDFVMIKGKVLKNREDQTLDVKITVKNVNYNIILDIINTKAESGAYDIKLPNGGKFLFTVEAPGFATQSEIVEVPVQTEFRPMKQEISFELPSDKLIIKSLFDETVSDSNYLLAINVIKEKSKLEVSSATELSSIDSTKEENASLAVTEDDSETVKQNPTEVAPVKLSNNDIVNIAYKDANVAEAEAMELREQADISLSFAYQKNEQAQSKLQEGAAFMLEASKTDDIVKKQTLTEQANVANKEGAQLNKETVAAFNIAKKIDLTAVSKRDEADLSLQYAKGLEKAVKSKDPEEALVQLEELEKKLDALNLVNADRFPITSSFKKEEENKKRELDKAVESSGFLKEEIADNETIISNLKADADKTRKAQVKQGLNNQIAELKNENKNKQVDYDQNEVRIAKLQKEYEGIKNESELVNSVVEHSKTSTSETAAAKVAAIDKNKLEEEVKRIAAKVEQDENLNQVENDLAAASVSSTVDNISADTVSNTSTSANTTAKVFSDINNKFKADLITAEKIENDSDREKEKANILTAWAEAIDEDVSKQKQDYIASTDSEMKAILAQKISDAEKSSQEKQLQANQSLAKVEALKQENVVSTASADNIKTKDTTASSDNNTVVLATEKQAAGNETVLKEENTKAALLEKQADTLTSFAADLKLKADNEKNPDTKKMMYEQSDEILQQAKEKKIQAAEVNGTVNKTEYTANKRELDKLAKSYATSTADDISMAEMMTDEALIYFDKAQKLRLHADTIKSLDEKEIALKEAGKNETLALERQKKSAGIYKNHKETVASATQNTNDSVSTTLANVTNSDTKSKDPANSTSSVIPAVASNTTDNAYTEINKKYTADLAAAEKNTNEIDREKEKAGVLKNWSKAIDAEVVKQKQDYATTKDAEKKAILGKNISDGENSSKEKTAQSDQSLAKVETLKEKNTDVAATADNTNSKDSIVVQNMGKTSDSAKKQFSYTDPAASEQITEANVLIEEANDLLAQSVVYKFETVDKTSKSVKMEREKQGNALVKRSQDKRLKAFELITAANNTEYNANRNNIEQHSKTTSTNTYPELSKAEVLNDESEKYFAKAQENRKKANSSSSYYAKETELEAAQNNEMLAMQKQKESLDIYKNYNPNVVTASVVTPTTAGIPDVSDNAVNSTSTSAVSNANSDSVINVTLVKNTTNPEIKTNELITTATTSPASEKQITYNEPAAAEQIVKADVLNKEADELLTVSVELKSQAVKQKNSDTKNTIYAQSEELTNEAQVKKSQASDLIANANGTEYDSNQNQLEQLSTAASKNTTPELLKAEILNDEAKKYFDKAKKQRNEANSANSYSLKATKSEEARGSEVIALKKQKESLDIYKKYNPGFVASADNTNKNNSIASSGVSTSANIAPLVKNVSMKTPEDKQTEKNAKTSFDVVLSRNEVFAKQSEPVYTVKNPIPINEKLPEGLIFKVQIGAFRKPIPQNLFQGMSPITGETNPKGFIRYTVGLFEKYTTAEKIKNKIVDLGYKDAFVVAFLNGKRIPINEAYAMAGGIPATVIQKNTDIENSAQNASVTASENVKEQAGIAKAQNVSAIQGLFYTVQVGVFSQPVLADRLYNMKPLYNETAPNGNLRYYTGIYKSVSRAAEATEMINDVGIKDAFVTAYYNGKRISIQEAKKYEMQGEGVFSTSGEMNKLPVFSTSTKPELTKRITIVDITGINGDEDENEDDSDIETSKTVTNTSNSNSTASNESGIVYKVQIGAFNDEVPLEIANKFLKIAKRGIKNYKDINGLTIYTVGNLSSYEDANLLKTEVVAENLTDAFVVAYRNGEKIPVEEARKLK